MSFILAGSGRPLSARAVECFTAGQREPPLALQANEAAPLRPLTLTLTQTLTPTLPVTPTLNLTPSLTLTRTPTLTLTLTLL